MLLTDDKLLSLAKGINALVIPERNVKYKHHKRLTLLANNLANYFRILLKEKSTKFRRELRRSEK